MLRNHWLRILLRRDRNECSCFIIMYRVEFYMQSNITLFVILYFLRKKLFIKICVFWDCRFDVMFFLKVSTNMRVREAGWYSIMMRDSLDNIIRSPSVLLVVHLLFPVHVRIKFLKMRINFLSDYCVRKYLLIIKSFISYLINK